MLLRSSGCKNHRSSFPLLCAGRAIYRVLCWEGCLVEENAKGWLSHSQVWFALLRPDATVFTSQATWELHGHAHTKRLHATRINDSKSSDVCPRVFLELISELHSGPSSSIVTALLSTKSGSGPHYVWEDRWPNGVAGHQVFKLGWCEQRDVWPIPCESLRKLPLQKCLGIQYDAGKERVCEPFHPTCLD